MTIDITFNPLEKLRRKLPLFVGGAIFLFGVFHVLTAVFATPPTSSYTPGETMSPSCAPGDTNCRVALIAGSILFSDGNTLISQDNSNLYWDDTNNRLGVGTTSPTNRLHIEGVNGGSAGIYLNNAIPSSTSYTLYNNSGTLIWNGNTVAMGSSFSGTTNRIPKFTTSSSIGDSVIYELSGNVGIGTTTPETSLHVLRSTASTNIPVVAAILGMSTSGTAAAGLGSFLNFNIEDDAGSMRGGGGFGSYWKSAANAAPQANLYVEDNAGTDIMTWQYGGNVGIGTTSPLLKFDVAGSGRFTGAATTVLTGSIDPAASTTVTGVGTLFLTELVIGDRITVTGETRTVTAIATNTSLTVDTAFSDNANDTSPDKLAAIFLARDSSNAVKMVINDQGNVGIGDTTPTEALLVVGNAGAGDIYATFAASANAETLCWDASGASLITDCTSLRKFKENVTDLNLPGIETIMKLSPREFDWIGKEDGIRHDLGFIAEEVDAVSPLLASYSIRDSEKGAELNGVKYERLTALLTKAIQEQQTQIEGINLKIEDLEAKIQSYSESIQTSTSTFQIQDVFSQILVWLEDKVVKVKELTTETIVVDKASINELSVKKITVENGINIKDSITGNIWCIGIANGEWSKVSGECVTAPAELQIQTGEVEPPAEVQPQEEEIASPPEAPRNDNDDSQPQEEEIIDTQGQTSGSGEVDN